MAGAAAALRLPAAGNGSGLVPQFDRSHLLNSKGRVRVGVKEGSEGCQVQPQQQQQQQVQAGGGGRRGGRQGAAAHVKAETQGSGRKRSRAQQREYDDDEEYVQPAPKVCGWGYGMCVYV